MPSFEQACSLISVISIFHLPRSADIKKLHDDASPMFNRCHILPFDMLYWLRTFVVKIYHLLEDLDLHILQAIDLVLFTEQRADALTHGLHPHKDPLKGPFLVSWMLSVHRATLGTDKGLRHVTDYQDGDCIAFDCYMSSLICPFSWVEIVESVDCHLSLISPQVLSHGMCWDKCLPPLTGFLYHFCTIALVTPQSRCFMNVWLWGRQVLEACSLPRRWCQPCSTRTGAGRSTRPA